MTAAQACGAGSRIVLVPVVAFTLVLAALLASCPCSGAGARRACSTCAARRAAGQFAPISAGKFSTFGGGSTVVYAQARIRTARCAGCSSQRPRQRLEVALAQRATHAIPRTATCRSSRSTTANVTRESRRDGTSASCVRREHDPGALAGDVGRRVELDGVPTCRAMASTRARAARRIPLALALPIMAVVMGIIAVPLARLRPRQGRYARVGYAILIFFVYIELAIAGRVWMLRVTPEWLGLWWVHGAVARRGGHPVLPRWLARGAVPAQHGARRRAAVAGMNLLDRYVIRACSAVCSWCSRCS
jgi:lipopolysaccharide export system permease protein